MNRPFDQLIAKHLQGSLTKEEKQLFVEMLEAPENQLKLAAEIDERFSDSSVEEVGNEATGSQIFKSLQAKLNEGIDKEIQQPAEVFEIGSYKKKRSWLSIAAAASVILVIALSVMLIFSRKDEQQVAMTDKAKPSDYSLSILQHEVNTTGKEKRLLLSDGSMIILSNKSEIIFRQPFGNERNITLIGKAYFKVAKDKTKPFTVVSGDITTTALGTEFTVTTFEKNNQVIVRLYEGKVVVKAADKNNRKLKNDIYLLAGQSFFYGGKTGAKVKEFKIDGTDAPEKILKQELSLDNPSLPEKVDVSYFMFNNQSLAEVFDNLSVLYNRNIIYNKKDLEKLYLIGKYNRTDSLETILKRIAIVNNLIVTREDNTFIISK